MHDFTTAVHCSASIKSFDGAHMRMLTRTNPLDQRAHYRSLPHNLDPTIRLNEVTGGADLQTTRADVKVPIRATSRPASVNVMSI